MCEVNVYVCVKVFVQMKMRTESCTMERHEKCDWRGKEVYRMS